MADAFRAACAEGVLLFSGGLGTELERRGAPTPLPLWATAAMESHPALLRDVHRRYVRAGADVVTANTFRTQRHVLARVGRGTEARRLTALAVRLAREGVAMAAPRHPVFVAASVAPLEDCYEPERTPDAMVLRTEHAVHVGSLVAAGATLLLVETMPTIREAVAALGAAVAGNVPAVVSFTLGDDGRLRSGESLADAARAVEPFAPLAICVNCCGPEGATRGLDRLGATTTLPRGVYANGRLPRGRRSAGPWPAGVSDRELVRHAARWLDSGVRLLGGCCGTTPRTIKRLARLRARRQRALRGAKGLSSSAPPRADAR